VLPSVEEGSALVTYEAMACGLPLIVTPNTGAVARDGVDGFVIPARDVGALQEKILYLYEHGDERRRMAESARQYVLENFTWDDYGDRIVSAYSKMIRLDAPQAAKSSIC
jgi:glycosyltransferase involved in cell wall biosynthesis